MTGNFSAAMSFLLDVLLSVYAAIIILRIILQLVKANFYNPLSQFAVKVTGPLLTPLRRIIPGWRGIDIAAILLVLVVMAFDVLLLLFIQQKGLPTLPYLVLWTLMKTAVVTIRLYIFTIILEAIASWFNPGPYPHPVIGVLGEVNRPILGPIRKFLPAREIGIDFSPLIAILVGYFFLILLPLPWFLR